MAPLEGEAEPAQLARWYRRFIDNRLGQSAERVAATGSRIDPTATEQFMFAACTDHVFIDEGHVIDYLNKACEAAAAIGDDGWALLLPTVVRATASATRHEEVSEWREPVDLIPIIDETASRITETRGPGMPDDELGAVGWALLADDPHDVASALVDAATRGASMEQLARAVAFAAALRLVRFHIQNDVGDWDTVHHTFTTANAVHQAIGRHPTPELARGIVHGALRVTSTASSTYRPPDYRPTSHGSSRRWSNAGKAAAASIRPARSSPDTSPPAAAAKPSSPNCAERSSERTPASTGSSPSMQLPPNTVPGRPARQKPDSYSSAHRAGWPPTPRQCGRPIRSYHHPQRGSSKGGGDPPTT